MLKKRFYDIFVNVYQTFTFVADKLECFQISPIFVSKARA
jgi:hypothetical protein